MSFGSRREHATAGARGSRRVVAGRRTLLAASALAATTALLLVPSAHIALAGSPPPLLFGQSVSEFADRRAATRKAAGDALVLLVGGRSEGDRARFRAENDVMYLTGVDVPGAALVLRPQGDATAKPETLYVPANRGEPDEIGKSTGIADVRGARFMWSDLEPAVRAASTVYILGPVGERGRHTGAGAIEARIKSLQPEIVVKDVSALIHPQRLRKSPGEVANLREAIRATIAGFATAARAVRPGVTELAIEGAVLAGFRSAGARWEGFPCVVGAGPNSIDLHHEPNDRRMQRDDTLVLDIGADVNYYSADLTRTLPVAGRFTPRQRAVYDLVREVQFACERSIVPGKTTWRDINEVARERFRQSTLRAKDSRGELQTMDRFFVHGVGHWLGMDVHDVGSSAVAFEPGMVITIEPGLYIASENIGIRIEDDFLITETGVERLSAALPTDIAAIERMMRSR